jgi:hypothetical protein
LDCQAEINHQPINRKEMKTKKYKGLITKCNKLLEKHPELNDLWFSVNRNGICINRPMYVNIDFDSRFKIIYAGKKLLGIKNDKCHLTFFDNSLHLTIY